MPRPLAEIAAGFAALGLVGLALALAAKGERGAEDGYRVSARFGQVDGLAVGNPVFLAGVKVGAVTALALDPAGLKPVVTMTVRRGTSIPVDSGALVVSDGVLGGKYVKIEPGSEAATMKDGARFAVVQDAVVVEQLLDKIVAAAEARRAKAREDRPGGDKP
jgi:phospholipid/cholesterol/gamma-HCH transport system substrate-binding protein